MRTLLLCLVFFGSLIADGEPVLPIIRQGAEAHLVYEVSTEVEIELPEIYDVIQGSTPYIKDGYLYVKAKSVDTLSCRCTGRMEGDLDADLKICESSLEVMRNSSKVYSKQIGGEKALWQPVRFHRLLGNCRFLVPNERLARDRILEHTLLDDVIYGRLLGSAHSTLRGVISCLTWKECPGQEIYRTRGKMVGCTTFDGPADQWDNAQMLQLRGGPLSSPQLVYQILDDLGLDTRDLEIKCDQKAKAVLYSAPLAAGLKMECEKATKVSFTLSCLGQDGQVIVSVTEKLTPKKTKI